MQRFIINTKAIISHKWTTITILLISTVSRVIHLIFFFNIRVDRSYQLLATQNFVHGNGITTAEVMPGNLSTIIYTPLIKWPPGYSLLLSPFYSLSGYNYLLSSLFLDLIFCNYSNFRNKGDIKTLGRTTLPNQSIYAYYQFFYLLFLFYYIFRCHRNNLFHYCSLLHTALSQRKG